MNRQEYLKDIYDLYNAGKISAETYDYMWANASQFVDEEDEACNYMWTYADEEEG